MKRITKALADLDEAERTRVLAYAVEKNVGREWAAPLWARVGILQNGMVTA